MDEEIQIINENTRKEKFKNLIIKYKKLIIIFISAIILLLIFFFLYSEYKQKKQYNLAEKFNNVVQLYNSNNETNIEKAIIDIINEKDSTYSPLALNFLIDNKLISDDKKINDLFDVIINDVNIDKELKNLIIFKKALYNSDKIDENSLLNILKPLLNSKSIWESHALYLMAEFFISKNEKQKAKEFFTRIIELDEANPIIKAEAQKKINRDLID